MRLTALLILIIIAVMPLAVSVFALEKETPEADSLTNTQTVKKSDVKILPKMLDLGSKSCIPCKKMAPILDSLREEYKGIAEIEFIDIRENRQASADHKITLIPTQIFFDTSGAEAYRHVGFFPADSITYYLEKNGMKR